MPAVAATNPPVLVAMVAAVTERIRVGSGGVMLPNHAPLVVAEQFALLEAAHPGRIDLGIGRAPGTDPVTAWALRHGGGGVEDDAVARFPEYVDNITAMLSPDGVGLRLANGTHVLRATPRATSVPGVWLLGSSDYSARLAAEKGLPYVFAHHFSGRGTAEALALYRNGFQPSADLSEPRTFLTVNAVVAPTQHEADRLALPNLRSMVALRSGQPLLAQQLVEEAEESDLDPHPRRPGTPDARPVGGRHTRVGGCAAARARDHVRRRRGAPTWTAVPLLALGQVHLAHHVAIPDQDAEHVGVALLAEAACASRRYPAVPLMEAR